MESPQDIGHNLGDTQPYGCKGTTEFRVFMSLEFGVRTLPAVIFFFTGGYRYYNIKHTARSQVRYTNNFIAKVVISSLITIACVAYIPLIMAQPQNAKNSSLVNQCHVEGFCFFNLIQAAAWGFSVFLIIFEY